MPLLRRLFPVKIRIDVLQPPQPKREPEPDGTKLAVRAATLGIVAAVLFGVLVFRLWALQVLRSATTSLRRTPERGAHITSRRSAATSSTQRS